MSRFLKFQTFNRSFNTPYHKVNCGLFNKKTEGRNILRLRSSYFIIRQSGGTSAGWGVNVPICIPAMEIGGPGVQNLLRLYSMRSSLQRKKNRKESDKEPY